MRAWLCQLLSVKNRGMFIRRLMSSLKIRNKYVSRAVNINMYAAYIEVAYLCSIVNHNCILDYLRLAIGCRECRLFYGCVYSLAVIVLAVYRVSAIVWIVCRLSASAWFVYRCQLLYGLCAGCQLLYGCVYRLSTVAWMCVQSVSYCMDCVQVVSYCMDCVQVVSYCMGSVQVVSCSWDVCTGCQLLYG